MLRRFYKNEAITWETFYWPILKHMLERLDLDTYYLVADTTDVGQDHRALVLSLAYHKRSLPLIWHVEPGRKGHISEDTQVELLTRLATHFQPQAPVIFLGDSEFDGVKVLRCLKRHDWYYICRTSPHLYVYPDEETAGFPLGKLVPTPGTAERQLAEVKFTTTHRYGPVSCYACWEEPHEHPLILIYHLPPGWSPRTTYKRRFGPKATVKRVDFLRHFLRRTLSIFKTGWRWFKHQLKLGHTRLPGDFKLPALAALTEKIMSHAKTPPTKGRTVAKIFKLLITF